MDTSYSTRDIGEAALLYSHRKKLIKLNDDGNKKVIFVFEDRDSCEPLAKSFWLRDATVNAKDFVDSLRTLKDLLYNR